LLWAPHVIDMNTSMIRKILVTTLILAFWGEGAGAAGLGRINVLSTLGQPLRAEVELSGTPDELDSMVVRMASQSAYKSANIDYGVAQVDIKTVVERRGNGAIIKLASSKPVGEPFMDLLLDLTWSGGHLQREFTFLLDPSDMPGARQQITAAPLVSAPVVSTPLEPSRQEPQRGASAPVPPQPTSVPGPRAEHTGTVVANERAVVKQPGAADYTVKRGDNISRIAAEVKPDEVTQEQMIAALYKANSKAFLGGNINRLRAGRILKVPDADEAGKIHSGEARRIIFKASNFEQYRKTVAAAAPTRDNATAQAGSGKVAPQVEPTSPQTQPKDKVTVTATTVGKQQSTAGSNTDSAATKARLQALADENASREKQLQDANSRIKALDENVKQLQKLLDLKNEALAKAEADAKAVQEQAKKAESKKGVSVEANKPVATQPAPVADSKPVSVAEASAPIADSAPVETTASAPSDAESVPVPQTENSAPTVAAHPIQTVSAPAPRPVESDSGLFNTVWALGGLVLVFAGAAYVYLKQRRRQLAASAVGTTQLSESPTTSPNSVFGNAGGQTVDTGGTSLLQTDFSQSGMASIDTDEGVDPVAEADVYMAYGRDAQAEEILLDALKNDPTRTAIYLKLLEIYAQRHALKQFENVATDLYAQTNGAGEDWAKAAALGVKLDPNNPLYREAGEEKSDKVETEQVVAPVPEVKTPAPIVVPTPQPKVEEVQYKQPEPAPVVMAPPLVEATAPLPELMNLDFNLDLENAADSQATRIESREDESLPTMEDAIDTQPSLPVQSMPLEFDLDSIPEPVKASEPQNTLPDLKLGEETDFDIGIETEGGRDVLAEVDLEKTNFEGSLLDFDFELGDEVEKPALDLSGVDLKTPNVTATSAATEEKVVKPSVAAPKMEPIQDHIDVDDEVATKLELAKAYEEMGDIEGARELLEEVIADGANTQKDLAKTMLARFA
jgi:pilus assembly protein FimV